MDNIYVTSAEDAGNLCVRLTFNDGHQSVVDIGDFIRKHPHPQYNKYLDPDLFRTFVIDDGNVARELSQLSQASKKQNQDPPRYTRVPI